MNRMSYARLSPSMPVKNSGDFIDFAVGPAQTMMHLSSTGARARRSKVVPPLPWMSSVIWVVRTAALIKLVPVTSRYAGNGSLFETTANIKRHLQRGRADAHNLISSSATHFARRSIHLRSSYDGNVSGPSRPRGKATTQYHAHLNRVIFPPRRPSCFSPHAFRHIPFYLTRSAILHTKKKIPDFALPRRQRYYRMPTQPCFIGSP